MTVMMTHVAYRSHPPNTLPRIIHLAILLRNTDWALQIYGLLLFPAGASPTIGIPAFEPEPSSPVSTTLAEPEGHVPSPPRIPTKFMVSDFKEERGPTLGPLSKPTPEPRAKSTLEPEPTAAQPVSKCVPVQETTSLPPTTPPSKLFVAFAPTHSPTESDVFHKPIFVISPLDHPHLGGGFGDTFLSTSTLGDDALSGRWESQSSSTFVNEAGSRGN